MMDLQKLSLSSKKNIVALGTFLVCFAYFSGAKHDYIEYMLQWDLVLKLKNPWLYPDYSFTRNAYGPAHLLYALFFGLHSLGPKMVGVFCYLGLVFWFSQRFAKIFEKNPSLYNASLLYLFSPFFLVCVFYNGDIDVHVAFWVLLSLIFMDREKEVLSGISLALATCLKFFPLAFVLILGVKRNFRIRPKFILAFGATCGLLFAACYWFWGDHVLVPIYFAKDRPPKLLSIFYYLEGDYSPLALMTNRIKLQALSLPLMAISGLAVQLLSWRKNLDHAFSCLLMSFAALLWYKVGHTQFYITPALLYAYWHLQQMEAYDASYSDVKNLNRAGTILIGWLSGFTLAYAWTGQFNFYPWRWMREVCSPIHFFVIVWVLLKLWQWVMRHKISASKEEVAHEQALVLP